jgi:sirohydrochlorin cobaltochelatase
MVESAKIYVVAVFISEGYFTQTVIPRELELQGRVTIPDGKEIYYCEPVGSHPLLHRARRLAISTPSTWR